MGATPRRYLLHNPEEINKEVQNQEATDDLFITKYPNNENICTIILDFDSKENTEKAFHETMVIHNFLKYKGVNTVIVSSTHKGYHLYIQIPPTKFDKETLGLERAERNKVFNIFTMNLINQSYFNFKSLDRTNTHAGLGGNIRIIGSTHPKTNKKVHIIKGKFITDYEKINRESGHYVKTMYEASKNQYNIEKTINEKKIQEDIIKRRRKYGAKFKTDPIKENDLREIFPQKYGGTVKKYDGYIFMQCPFHVDRAPSLKVTKEWFYCTACGKKGNIWTLIKEKEIKL